MEKDAVPKGNLVKGVNILQFFPSEECCVHNKASEFSERAGREQPNAQKEDALFYNLDNTREAKPADYPEDNATTSNASVAKLNGNDPNKRIGPSMILKVMADDTIQVAAMHNMRLSGPGYTTGSGLTANDVQGLKQKDLKNINNNKPKAYLNYVFFDKQFKFVEDGSGVKQVDGEHGKLETLSSGKVVAKKNGYVYIFTSNEPQQPVFFDNLGVMQITGPVLEETHYYPFGLTMSGISTVAPLQLANNYKYNGIELNNSELSDGSGLDIYTAQFRGLDPQVGRFTQIDPKTSGQEDISPYASMGNNPGNNVDPLGDFKHKFGSWLYKVFHGGGEIGRNRFDEYYVAQTKVDRGQDGIATVTTTRLYGKGRDQYSAGEERLSKEYKFSQDIKEMTRMGIWDPENRSSKRNPD